MVKYIYTGSLTDIGVNDLGDYEPRLRVSPEEEAFGPDGLVSAQAVPVTVNADGTFQISLVASTDLVGAATRRSPVRHVLELALFQESFDGAKVLHRRDQWAFVAAVGGGHIGDMYEFVSHGPIIGALGAPPENNQVTWIDLTDVNEQGVKIYFPRRA
ncbi:MULTISPECIES: hypothetical protein [unclassified Microbacterium]|uniref:hypothetical protein n=1 Tax=Microbacterium TaxID=33882 RepID=UPI003BA3C8DA